MTRQDELPAGWLTRFRRGVLSGAGLLLLAVTGCAIPSFAVWLVPGSDTSPASSAVKSGALLALAAAHGGIRLNGEQVSLAPLLVTGLLGWLIAGQSRRTESWSSIVGLATGYGLASGLLARWAGLGATHAPGMSSALAGAAFTGVVGSGAYGGPMVWHRLTDRYRRVVRAAGSVVCCYVGAGALLVAGSLLLHLSAAVALQRRLAPGVAGLPVALLGIGFAPNAALAGTGYLAGPGFGVGSHTHISALATRHGPLPDFPVLAAVPTGGPATGLGLLAILVAALLAGWLCARGTRSAAGWPTRLADVGLAALLAGCALGLLTGLASGGIGSGALGSIGARWWAVAGCCSLLVLVAGSAWTAVDLLRSPAARNLPAAGIPAAGIPAAGGSGRAAVAAEPAPARLRAITGSAGDRERPKRTTTEPPDRSRNAG